ncbi:hypothetical protein QT972_09650 [Microcoleus sp. herbarium7]|uniref:helix-turn-helix transcriptional regulator n=1 Tax=Microcoleus sp. herbarium7 TaxID=3055435 RepID=UPI002FD3A000
MYWKKVDSQNLPQGEVLAINLKSPDALDYQEKGLGYLSYDLRRVWCHDGFGKITLIGCTHYIEIDKIQVPSDELTATEVDCLEKIETVLSRRSVRPVHPGEILADAIEGLEMTQEKFAELLGVTPETVKEIILGWSPITPEMATRIGADW